MKLKLGIEEGEDHQIKQAIESGSHKKGKIKWVWGHLPSTNKQLLSKDEKSRLRSSSLEAP